MSEQFEFQWALSDTKNVEPFFAVFDGRFASTLLCTGRRRLLTTWTREALLQTSDMAWTKMSTPVDEHFNLAEKSEALSGALAARPKLARQSVQFDLRFLDRYVGAIISDPSVAIVELLANAWDAYATKVDITWPARGKPPNFQSQTTERG